MSYSHQGNSEMFSWTTWGKFKIWEYPSIVNHHSSRGFNDWAVRLRQYHILWINFNSNLLALHVNCMCLTWLLTDFILTLSVWWLTFVFFFIHVLLDSNIQNRNRWWPIMLLCNGKHTRKSIYQLSN